jgi:hypothetical protein
MRDFGTGATRDGEDGKYDYEGFLSPLVLECFAAYMHKHRVQADGSLRASDNWQKGIPLDVYMKSGFRHFMDWWALHRERPAIDISDGHMIFPEEALCALLFNVMGYLHEIIKVQYSSPPPLALDTMGLPHYDRPEREEPIDLQSVRSSRKVRI